MKNKISKRLILTTLVVLLVCVFLFCSCGILSSRELLSAEINEKGELILEYTDGTSQNLGVVTGKDGENGLNGEKGDPGENGADGKDGTNGADGKDGSITISGADQSVSLAVSKGLRSAVSVISAFTDSTGSFYSNGAGVIYEYNKALGNATIITNYHVVYDAGSTTGISEDISVFIYGAEYADFAMSATYIGGSMNYDIAVLKITGSEVLKNADVDAVSVRDSSEVLVGETAIAIGNPNSDGIAATSGIVSVDSENFEILGADEKTYISMRVMRVDTPVNHGNSGGGLYDKNGNLIGIVNAKLESVTIENMGYAIPSNIAIAVAKNILHYCDGETCTTMQRPLLGITVTIDNPRAEFDTSTGLMRIYEDVVIAEVSYTSAAFGYLTTDDVIKSVTVDGKTTTVTRQYLLIDSLLAGKIGDVVIIEYERDGVLNSFEFVISYDMLTSY